MKYYTSPDYKDMSSSHSTSNSDSTNIGGYRYFFNGQEGDNEVFGDGVSLTAEFWQYDSRLGRRWNVDPKFQSTSSVYSCFVNNPICFTDIYGDTVRYISGRERMDVFFARLFSKAFRKEFKVLKESTHTYTYSRMTKNDQYNSNGFISVDDVWSLHPVSQFTIHYSLIAKDVTGRSPMHAVFEETFHAVDFELKRSSSLISIDQNGLYVIGHDAADKSHEARAWQFAAINAPFHKRRPLVRAEDGHFYYVYNTLISQIRKLHKSSDIPKIELLLYEEFNVISRRMNNETKKAIAIKQLYK